MKTIPIDELEAGTKYSKPVFVDGEHLLVPQGVPIRQKDLDRLKKWGVDTVTTDGELVTELSALRETADTIGSILDQKGEPAQLQTYRQAIGQLDRMFSEIRTNRAVERAEIDGVAEKITETTQKLTDAVVAFVLRNDRAAPSLGKSAVDSCILSLVVGVSLSMDQLKLHHLSLGAVLHDVGMLRIPEAILSKKSDLTIDEIKRMRTHPLHSYKIVSKDLGYPEEVGMIVLQHHERWDGKGYPRRLSGKQIALEARIVSVADAFEAMVKDKPYRGPMIGYTAMRQLLNDNSRRFDSEILKVFIKSIGIYPVGSFVLLNNGGIGRVIKINPGAPLRPAIKIIISATGEKFLQSDGPVLDLLKDEAVFIAKAIDPKNALGTAKTI